MKKLVMLAGVCLIAISGLEDVSAEGVAIRLTAKRATDPELTERLRTLIEAVSEQLTGRGLGPVSIGQSHQLKGWIVDRFELALRRHRRGFLLTVEMRRSLVPKAPLTRTKTVPFADGLVGAALSLIDGMRPPLARLALVDSRRMRLTPLVGGPRVFKRGGVLTLIRRPADRAAGQLMSLSYGVIEERGQARLVTGSRWRSDRRFVLYGAPMKLTAAPLRLHLVDRSREAPLIGYQIYRERNGHKPEYLTLTDGEGRATVPMMKPELVMLQIRFNNLIVARFPMAPSSDRGELTLKLRRRADATAYHRELNRILRRFDDLLLRREVALEDVSIAISARRFKDAKRGLSELRSIRETVEALRGDLRLLEVRAAQEGKDIGASTSQARALIDQALARLDPSKFEGQLGRLEARITARKRAQALLLKANRHLADGKISDALAALGEAVRADPSWDLARKRRDRLAQGWKAKSPEHANARRLVFRIQSMPWYDLETELNSIRNAIAELKRVGDLLTLRVARAALTGKLGSLNTTAEAMIAKRHLAYARRVNNLSIALQPIIAEISSGLDDSEGG